MGLDALSPHPLGYIPDKGLVVLFGLPLTRTDRLSHAFSLVRDLFTAEPSRARLITFANPLSVRVATKDSRYSADLARMDLVFCDGIALAVAARQLSGFPMERVSFDSTSIAPLVLDHIRTENLSVVIVGGRPGVAETAARRIQTAFPGIPIIGTMDGYQEREAQIAQVLKLDPKVVICGMGAPRQEAFLSALATAGWKGVGFTCGGYLDHLGDRFDFYPALFNRLNLRWLYRLMREPRRIGYRCFVEYGPFWRMLFDACFKTRFENLFKSTRQKVWMRR